MEFERFYEICRAEMCDLVDENPFFRKSIESLHQRLDRENISREEVRAYAISCYQGFMMAESLLEYNKFWQEARETERRLEVSNPIGG
ncbi:MAG: hypothetical protein RL557_483 [archaeon]|jgi:hypothetical protein